ncbi:MAG: ABC transporter ATP-binding protein [Desulfitobacteriaceae bacterium]|nr:ABC transporter ATP-binding protein [Desulfitobacteriaceae bacterium]MDD4346913.1 ABC transporter ATP-binding protein [Desulfitobacteriaceae bacterium]MDD4401983.1 ABC transporter ATP-binding protein [Desulfitobacteriaceae bacterium]
MSLLDVSIKHAGYMKNEVIIRNINFSLKHGELLGLIGPNGSGKSTIIKAIAGLLPNLHGEIIFNGQQKRYAYIPEQPVFYEELTLMEHLELAAAAYSLTDRLFEKKTEELLRIFKLHDVKHQLPVNFSKGMQQKTMLIIGFLINPDVFVVDEPFIGLDPRATKNFLALLDIALKQGAGVLMSTHILDTAEKICNSFVLISDGNLVCKGTLEDIRRTCNLPRASLFDCFDYLTGDNK